MILEAGEVDDGVALYTARRPCRLGGAEGLADVARQRKTPHRLMLVEIAKGYQPAQAKAEK